MDSQQVEDGAIRSVCCFRRLLVGEQPDHIYRQVGHSAGDRDVVWAEYIALLDVVCVGGEDVVERPVAFVSLSGFDLQGDDVIVPVLNEKIEFAQFLAVVVIQVIEPVCRELLCDQVLVDTAVVHIFYAVEYVQRCALEERTGQ